MIEDRTHARDTASSARSRLHQGDPSEPRTLGAHTLVIADHNGAFAPNAQPRIRYTQPGAVLKEDSITHWHGHRQVASTSVQTASWDYRAVNSHSASMDAGADHAQPMPLVHHDQPGTYAYETPAQAERRVLIQQQSLQADHLGHHGRATGLGWRRVSSVGAAGQHQGVRGQHRIQVI